ncbi:MAG: thioesterase family protein, partial [Parvibaculaceae bacterium]|nr:thioesterase family protein [Parvibaculaceae bacterium]
MSQQNDAFIEIHRDSVQTWESDQMGHLNVQFYMEKAQCGLASLFAEMGLGPRALRAAGQRLDVQDHHVRFLREQRPGAPFYLVGGVLSAQPDLFVVYEEMRATLDNTPAATFRAEVRLVDDATGSPVPFPQAVIDASGKLHGELPKHGMPRGLTLEAPRAPITLTQAEERGLIATYQGEVLERMCDGQGFMNKRHYMGLVSDSIPNLLVKTRGDDRSNNG